MIKYADGDLIKKALKGEFDVIVHGANCFCTMGAGVARSIKFHFPEAFRVDAGTTKGSKAKLGTFTCAEVFNGGKPLVVVNAYTQYKFWGNKVNFNYDAFSSCLKEIRKTFHGKRIGMPMIGAGLAGGNWKRIAEILRQELGEEDVTVVIYHVDKAKVDK